MIKKINFNRERAMVEIVFSKTHSNFYLSKSSVLIVLAEQKTLCAITHAEFTQYCLDIITADFLPWGHHGELEESIATGAYVISDRMDNFPKMVHKYFPEVFAPAFAMCQCGKHGFVLIADSIIVSLSAKYQAEKEFGRLLTQSLITKEQYTVALALVHKSKLSDIDPAKG